MPSQLRQRFLDLVCNFQMALRLLYLMSIIFLLLLIYSFVNFTGSSSTHAILLLDFVIVGSVLVVSRTLIAKC